MITEKRKEIGPAAILCCPWQHCRAVGGAGILGAGLPCSGVKGHHTGVETSLGRAKQCGNLQDCPGNKQTFPTRYCSSTWLLLAPSEYDL